MTRYFVLGYALTVAMLVAPGLHLAKPAPHEHTDMWIEIGPPKAAPGALSRCWPCDLAKLMDIRRADEAVCDMSNETDPRISRCRGRI